MLSDCDSPNLLDLSCGELMSPFSKHSSPAQQANLVPEQSPLVETGSLTYFSDLKKRHVLYTPVKTLGAGAFGTVYQCHDRDSSDSVAIKYIRIHDAVDGIPQWALREIALLRRCSARHPNIISLMDMHCKIIDGKRCDIHLVLEYCDMDLKRYINLAGQKSGITGLEPRYIKELMYQLLQGLDFLHVISVAHRDIKPQNVLIKHGVVKIADFGLGKIMFEKAPVSLEVVTLHYRPPEVLLNVNYSLTVDIWSVGCIFAEMCDDAVLLRGDSEINQLKIIFSFIGIPKSEDWPPDCSVVREFFQGSPDRSVGFLDKFVKYIGSRGVDLLKQMLKFNPSHRVSTFGALRHDYFDGHISSVPYTAFSSSSSPSQNDDFDLHDHDQHYSRSSKLPDLKPDFPSKMRGL